MRKLKSKGMVVSALFVCAAMFLVQPLTYAGSAGKGNLTGFIYGSDKTTPVQGAVVMLKNIATGAVVESAKSDVSGAFMMAGLDRGMYVFGVTSSRGEFESEAVLGIAANETAKLAVALIPNAEVDPKAEDAPQISGEKWVGKVISYDEATKTARVYMNNNLIKKDEDFHIKGDKDKYKSETDFWQKAKILQENGLDVKKAVAERYYTILLEKPALVNDFLYIKKSRGLFLFLLPGGLAAVMAGTTALIITTVDPPEDASAFKK